MTAKQALLLAGGGFLAYKLISYSSLAENLTTSIKKTRIKGLSASGVTLGVTAEVNNPTRSTATITQRAVTLTSNGNVLGTSNAGSAITKIAALATTALPEINIQISIGSFLSLLSGVNYASLLQMLQQGKAAQIISLLKVPVEVSMALYADGIFLKTPPTAVA
jgi:hypothetical protein